MKGKLIVIEGSDGSGKSTQFQLLLDYLTKSGISTQTIKFPQHGISFFGKMVDEYLRGEYGTLETVNPYLISTVYAMDRAGEKDRMNQWLVDGKYILLDRYVPSNLAHQCGRLPVRKQKKFIDWELELEYKINKIPREDIVIFLHIPHKISLKLMRNKDRNNRAYAKGKKHDIHEKDTQFMKNSERAYLRLVKQFPYFVKISCVNKKGELKSREKIHAQIISALKKRSII